MRKKYVLIIDSGIGGISTLSNIIKLSQFNYLYFADYEFSPYGNKKKSFIQHRLCQIIDSVSNQFCLKLVVLACNTATTSSISFLRSKYSSITFIGTEPAMKLARDLGFKSPLVIATQRTTKQIKNNDTTTKFLSLDGFASEIEQFLINKNILSYFKLLKTIFYLKSKQKKHDCIVLGCTHYVLIKNIIQKYINLPVVDGNNGVSNQVRKKLNQTYKKSTTKFIISSKQTAFKQKYKKILKQTLANQSKLC